MRNRSLIHWAAFSAPLLIILAVIWFSFPAETDAIAFFKSHRTTHVAVHHFMRFLTDWCNPVFYVFYAIMLYKAWRSGNRERLRFIVILLITQGIVAGLAVHFLKSFIGRPRPGQGHWFDPMTTRGSYHSLPSGHTAEITGWTLPLALRRANTWLTIAFALFVGLVGFSRIYLGWHHPSDVFFGWLLGSFTGFAVMTIASTSFFRTKA